MYFFGDPAKDEAITKRKRVKHGGDISSFGVAIKEDLSVNVNPQGPPAFFRDAFEAACDGIMQYPDPSYRKLKQAASLFYGVPEENILCGNGTSELLAACGRIFAGKRVLLTAPCYTGYERAFSESTVCRYRTLIEDCFDVTPPILEETEKADPAALTFGNPSNPAGRMMPKDLLESIIKRARSRDSIVILDESFIELSDEGERASMVDIIPKHKNLIVLRSLTKAFAVPGLRLGFALTGSKDIISVMEDELPEWNISALADSIGQTILMHEKTHAYLEESRILMKRYRTKLEDNLKDSGIDHIPSKSCYVLMHTARPLQEEMLGRGILIRDCSDMEGLGTGWYRTAVSAASASIVF